MSRIGKKPVAIPNGVTVTFAEGEVVAKGPKGELRFPLTDEVVAEMTDDGVTVSPRDKSKRARSMWGMTRSMMDNLVIGVSEGFTRKLDITGVGYRASIQGKNLQLQLGFSHDIQFPIPDGIDIKCPTQTEIEISGIDKQVVGELAAKIRGYRPPEPYKGKGVRYSGEYIFRKEGKKK